MEAARSLNAGDRPVSRFWRLDKRPRTAIENDDLSLQSAAVAPLAEGQVLMRSVYLSLDATNRLWMEDIEELYMPPVALGTPMLGFVLAEVAESRNPGFRPGQLAMGLGHWADYVVTDGAGWTILDRPDGIPLALAFGVLAIAGPTAWVGLLDIGRPRPGATVVVSAAAGAAGACAAQIARLKGCRVIGIAGGVEKCAWLREEAGLDAVIDYKAEDVAAALRRLAPAGIDLLYENVGGDILDASLANMALGGTVVCCGLISTYNGDLRGSGPRMFHNVIMKRLRIEGFVILDHMDRYPAAWAELIPWLREGRLKFRLDIADGLDNAVAALRSMYDGGNKGKLMVRIGAEP
ncbi:NADP-dependent oxidoreductase [Zavarzinia compransoris]|uniref:NADP-dependent oxidoreductase n=1 Tax=Zavarzinia compransoris TaxID=1264899 RepID=A0A317DV78_9PROT|nr:NADP-dependent oxidoreductase [Zavarzinia compransoris]PWR17776.1 NADP-dependent oxidoreductase [Zavarzinia compransoris]TDP49305.1 hypothetical protein DES42_101677 [Zavarzinia compransoris]